MATGESKATGFTINDRRTFTEGGDPRGEEATQADGKPAFANAIVRAAQPEADYWLSKSHMDAAPADRKGSYQSAMSALNPYIAAGKFKPFTGDVELAPGIRAVAAPGHTAGHTL